MRAMHNPAYPKITARVIALGSLAGAVCLSSTALAQSSIDELSIDNPGGYILASDANVDEEGYDRDGFQSSFLHTVEPFDGAHFEERAYEFRYTYRVLDAEGNALILFPGLPGTEFSDPIPPSEYYSVTGSVTVPPNHHSWTVPVETKLPASFDTVYPDTEYQVEVTIEEDMGGEDDPPDWHFRAEGTSPFRQLIHFTHQEPDPESNHVIVVAEEVLWEETTIIDTVDGQTEFQVTVNTTLHRWDDFEEGGEISQDPVLHFLELELKEGIFGESVTLDPDPATYSNTFDMDSHVPGEVKVPYSRTVTANLNFRPAGQLDSVSHEYHLTATSMHTDDPDSFEGFRDQLHEDNTVEAPLERLLHFTGRIYFGDIEATIHELAADPEVLVTQPSYLLLGLEFEEKGGMVDGVDDFTFAFEEQLDLSVQLFPDGDAYFPLNADPVELSPTEDHTVWTHGGKRIRHGTVVLDATGATAPDFAAFLPAGSGIIPNVPEEFDEGQWRVAMPLLGFPGTELGQDLLPADPILARELDERIFTVESLPLFFTINGVLWDTGEEEMVFQVSEVDSSMRERYQYLDELEADDLENPGAATKVSNDQYFLAVADLASGSDLSLRQGEGGEALVSCVLTLNGGRQDSHFPFGGSVFWNTGELHVEDSRVDSEESYLGGVPFVVQLYDAGCPDGDCGDVEPVGEARAIVPDDNKAYFTPEGGIHASGELHAESDPDLVWGSLSAAPPTHEAGDFDRADFYSPGIHLSGYDFPDQEARAPGALLLSGVDPDDLAEMERPGEPAYLDGLGNYAGLNYRATGEEDGFSRIGGEDFDFALTTRSKYYIRWSGVAGIHEAVDFTEQKDIYGYPFDFSNFGLAFLRGSNDGPHDGSRVNGTITVVEPAGFQQDFEEMEVTCIGALDDAVPVGEDPKTMVYWNATFSTHAIRFEPDPDNVCDAGSGYLALDIGTEPGTLSIPLYGTIGFFNTGQIIAAAEHETIESKLIAPRFLELAGPGHDFYRLVPVTDITFNSHHILDEYGGDPEEIPGFLSFAAGMNTTFFEQIQTQVHISPAAGEGEDREEDMRARLYHVMGGWPDEGWRDGQDNHFFNNVDFDGLHAGFPHDAGTSLEDYRQPTREDDAHTEYLARARKEWLNVVPLNYPLQWNPVNRAFRSPRTINDNLLVVDVDHQVLHLDTSNAEISFGAEYDGLPEINATNMLFDSLDGQLGAAEALVNSAGETLFSELVGGVDGFASLLEDKAEKIFRSLFDSLFEGTNAVFDELADEINAYLGDFDDFAEGWVEDQADVDFDIAPDDYIADVDEKLDAWDAYLDGLEAATDQKREDIKTRVAAVTGAATGAIDASDNLIARIHHELGRVRRSLQVMLPGEVEVDGVAVEGLLSRNDAAGAGRQFIENLVIELANDVVAGLVTDVVQDVLNDLLAQAEPTFEQVETFLQRIDGKLADLQEKLMSEQNGQTFAHGEFAEEIQAEIAGAEERINGIVDQVFDEAIAHIRNLPRTDRRLDEIVFDEEENGNGNGDGNGDGDGEPLDGVTDRKDEFMTFLRQSFEDAFFESDLMGEYHRIVRHRLYDIYLEKQETVDTLFARVNDTTKSLLNETVGAAEDHINEMAGAFSDKMGAANIVGHAHIQDDALRLLRLDGDFLFELGTELQIQAYLQIRQQRADGSGGCQVEAGGRAVETTIGAVDMPLDWLSPDLRADIETRFSFDTSGAYPLPTGLGGSFAITEGTVDYETFAITDLAAAMAFSHSGGESGTTLDEAFISAAMGLELNDYAMFGGVFFGRACDLTPILIWDRDVAEVLGDPDPHFTGAYVYGEASIPLIEAVLGVPASCMLDLTASMGAGVFMFVEGPTVGGKLHAGLTGRVVCLVSVTGEITMVGSKTGTGPGGVALHGTGKIEGTIGKRPLRKTKTYEVSASYVDNSWDVSRD